jgi:hypothetical protein
LEAKLEGEFTYEREIKKVGAWALMILVVRAEITLKYSIEPPTAPQQLFNSVNRMVIRVS